LLVFASSTTAFISQTVIGGVRLIYLPLVICSSRWSSITGRSPPWPSLSLVVSVLSIVAALSWVAPPLGRLRQWGRRQSFADLTYGLLIGRLAILAVTIIVAPVIIVLMTSLHRRPGAEVPPKGFSLGLVRQLFDPVKSTADPPHRRQLADDRGLVDPVRRRARHARLARPGAQSCTGSARSPTTSSCRRWCCPASPSAWRRWSISACWASGRRST
jgi:hypothetical protein